MSTEGKQSKQEEKGDDTASKVSAPNLPLLLDLKS